ncbi:hypothetical protein ASD12_18010 [Mesorhizobium sp. Root102]|uniref:hypothetical protein n=1 Tax=Mesorhizobium sp. Root102 TaxID=1736422 RepID=UPI0006F7F41F|nr:hypothetical protein [Mesorhizobium sp. Root102]KQU77695.1 hypothetical protein ASD12_18010 [Mesorhizobium sp. Root102]
MTITYRSVKGSNLNATEVDNNFHDVDDRLTDLEENPPEATGISNITVSGTQMTIYLEDATVLGPYTLPQANFRPSVVATITTTTYDPVLGDANGYKRCTNDAGCVVNLPSDAELAFPIDGEITWWHDGVDPVSFDWSTDTVVRFPSGYLPQTAFRYVAVTSKKVAADTWHLIGLLAEDVTA